MQEEGSTFSSLLGEVRRELASRHLGDSDVSITEAAFLLGFSDSRAFQRVQSVAKCQRLSPDTQRK